MMMMMMMMIIIKQLGQDEAIMTTDLVAERDALNDSREHWRCVLYLFM